MVLAKEDWRRIYRIANIVNHQKIVEIVNKIDDSNYVLYGTYGKFIKELGKDKFLEIIGYMKIPNKCQKGGEIQPDEEKVTIIEEEPESDVIVSELSSSDEETSSESEDLTKTLYEEELTKTSAKPIPDEKIEEDSMKIYNVDPKYPDSKEDVVLYEKNVDIIPLDNIDGIKFSEEDPAYRIPKF